MLFLIPGVIAFGVDFATGVIYLPSKRAKAGAGIEQDDMVVIKVNSHDITLAMLEETLEQRTGEKINLHSENVQVMQILRPSLSCWINSTIASLDSSPGQ